MGNPRAPVGLETRSVGAALQAWSEAGRPAMSFNELAPDRVRVVVLDHETLQDRCMACVPGTTQCRERFSCGFLVNMHIADPPRLLVYVSSGFDELHRATLIAHETLHILRGLVLRRIYVEGLHVPAWAVPPQGDLPDRNHEDVALWSEIDARATEILQGAR